MTGFLSYPETLALVCPLVFLAGFVDSIAGGGGIISLPAYLAAGLPAHLAAGSNKFAMMLGTSAAAGKYAKSGNVKPGTALAASGAAIPGAWLGTRLALALDERLLKTVLLVIIPAVAVFILVNRNLGKGKTGNEGASGGNTVRAVGGGKTRIRALAAAVAAGFAIGAYDGLIGPGTGTFLILIFSSVLGYSLLVSSGNAKIVNLTSNVVSTALFIRSGNVWFALAIPAACCTIAGNWLGSHLAIRNGARIIRPAMIGVLLLLFVKIIFDLLQRS